MNSHTLLWLALALIVVWVIATVTKFIVGTLLTLILVAAVIFFLVWLVRRFV